MFKVVCDANPILNRFLISASRRSNYDQILAIRWEPLKQRVLKEKLLQAKELVLNKFTGLKQRERKVLLGDRHDLKNIFQKEHIFHFFPFVLPRRSEKQYDFVVGRSCLTFAPEEIRSIVHIDPMVIKLWRLQLARIVTSRFMLT